VKTCTATPDVAQEESHRRCEPHSRTIGSCAIDACRALPRGRGRRNDSAVRHARSALSNHQRPISDRHGRISAIRWRRSAVGSAEEATAALLKQSSRRDAPPVTLPCCCKPTGRGMTPCPGSRIPQGHHRPGGGGTPAIIRTGCPDGPL
jgi:hypothetical protein